MTDPVITPEAEKSAATVDDEMYGVPELLATAMRKRGFSELTSVQRAVLESESEGRDLRISSQTGSGKTVAIGLALAGHLDSEISTAASDRPSSHSSRNAKSIPSVLVLVPTRELAMQVRDELQWLFSKMRGIRTEVVMGGTSVLMERRALAQGPHIVVGTPGRTLDHIRGGALVSSGIQHVVLDESDRMLDMGFRDELEAILEQLPKVRRTHLISATFPAAVQKLANRFQKKPLHIEGTRLGAANVDIDHTAHLLDRRESYAALVNLLLLNEGGRCLIFVERRVDASALATKLSGDGFPVQPFSGELPQAQRTRTLNSFRDGTIRTLVSTDVAARGIDVPDIELVVHMDPPSDSDSYVHRSGRTGRAGRTGKSVMLVPPRIQRQAVRLLEGARIQVEWKPVPAASKVRKQLRKRFRQEMRQRLTDECDLSQAQIDYAKDLLDGRDPAAVVALLLDLAQPKPIREPMEIREPKGGGAPVASRSQQGFAKFSINWGEKTGASANRVLGHVCRRGQVKSHSIGAIEIGTDRSTFDVDSSVVARFEKMVRRRDARDPNLRIVRAAGTGGAGEARSAGGSSGRVEKARGRPKQGPKFGTKPKRPFASKRKGRA
ncbi:MAG TPA: DEAD/DEAH box helicase [Myxococcales bacterium]|nr:DEAD/DEAH box helicase [Myxococcales bacterium]